MLTEGDSPGVGQVGEGLTKAQDRIRELILEVKAEATIDLQRVHAYFEGLVQNCQGF